MNESIKALKKALKGKKTDSWAEGTVIRWLSGGRYSYAAIKTPVGWYTTAVETNRFVPQVLKYESLIEVLSRSEVSNIAVASEWVEL